MARFEIVGKIGIDAGLCWIGDPCYLANDSPTRLAASAPPPSHWERFVEWLYPSDDADPWRGAREHPLGVVVGTGYGDGEYPVQVRRNSEGRVAELLVVFIAEGE